MPAVLTPPPPGLCSRCRVPSLGLGVDYSLALLLLLLEQLWGPGQNTCALVFPRPTRASQTVNRFGGEGRSWVVTPA